MAPAVLLDELQLLQLAFALFCMCALGTLFGLTLWQFADWLAGGICDRFFASERGQRLLREARQRRAAAQERRAAR